MWRDSETNGSENITCASIVPQTPPKSCAAIYASASFQDKPPSRASATETTGFRCAPEIGPKVRIRANSAAPVAIVLASNANATFPPASRSAIIPEPTTAATRSSVPRNSAVTRLGRFGFTSLADAIDFFLDGELVEARKRQAKQQAYPAVKHHEGIAKRAFDLLRRSYYGGRIGNTPMGGHRLTGPDGANFLGGVVADREYEIELRCSGLSELVPIFAAQVSGRQSRNL